MRVALFLLTLAVVALIVALTLAVVRWRRHVKARRAARLDHFKIVLREVDVAADRWDPADAVGADLVGKIRDELMRYYLVPHDGQRDFSFAGNGKKADAAAVTSTTKDNQEATVSGTVKFTMKLSCKPFTDPEGKKWPGGTAQFFHEKIGNKDPNEPAYNTEGSSAYGEGWSKMLAEYMGFAINDALDDETPGYDLDEINRQADKKNAWQIAVKEQLPKTLKSMTFGVEVFKVESVLLARPGVRKDIADARAAKIAAQEQVAASDVIANRAKTWPGGLPAYQQFLREQAVNKAIQDGRVKAVPVPYGSPVIVPQN